MNHPFHANSKAEANAILRENVLLSRRRASNLNKTKNKVQQVQYVQQVHTCRSGCPTISCPLSPAYGGIFDLVLPDGSSTPTRGEEKPFPLSFAARAN